MSTFENIAPRKVPELSPFEVETLRVYAGGSNTAAFYSNHIDQRAIRAANRLRKAGLVHKRRATATKAGHAVLAAYGVA